MSDIPPAPPKSPILIIVLLAAAGAVAGELIGFIRASSTHHTSAEPPTLG